MTGCVFFICTAGAVLAGGSGNTIMRAVSFFGPCDEAGDELDDGLTVGAAAPEGAEPTPEPAGATGAGDLGINGGAAGDGTAAPTGVPPDEGTAGFLGKNGGGETRLVGGGGKGAWARGGRGAAGAPRDVGGAGRGAFGLREGVSLAGGRAGKFIRTVSRAAAPVPAGWLPGPDGKLMRTVSFFGSFGSAMIRRESVKEMMRENPRFVTR